MRLLCLSRYCISQFSRTVSIANTITRTLLCSIHSPLCCPECTYKKACKKRQEKDLLAHPGCSANAISIIRLLMPYATFHSTVPNFLMACFVTVRIYLYFASAYYELHGGNKLNKNKKKMNGRRKLRIIKRPKIKSYRPNGKAC